MITSRAGLIATNNDLIDISGLSDKYYKLIPDFKNESQKVIFGTSGHRGSSMASTFNEVHIVAIAQAIADFRKVNKITGPCYIGKDTHALSDPALKTVIEVLSANFVPCIIAKDFGFTPTPVISHAILKHNSQQISHFSDGIVITPSHNPPCDGGIKYNSVNGAPADYIATTFIQDRANAYLSQNLADVKRISFDKAIKSEYVTFYEYENDYICDLASVINFNLIVNSSLKLGVDPLGGAGITYWQRIAQDYKLDLHIINDQIDPTFSFMHLDHDEVIRMDCSSPYAMAGILKCKDDYDLAFGNDTDHDRHGIVTHAGLMPSNDFLASSIYYLFENRPNWDKNLNIAKTAVTSSFIDKVAKHINREVLDYPVGFKWFADGLYNQKTGFACEESAGASFLTQQGKAFSTDKDGIIMCLLAAEMTAKLGVNPAELFTQLQNKLGKTYYSRTQASLNFEGKKKLASISANNIKSKVLAGDKITHILTTAPANNESIGGVKVMTDNGWFVARPSGTEDAYKIYAESYKSDQHLKEIELAAKQLVDEII